MDKVNLTASPLESYPATAGAAVGYPVPAKDNHHHFPHHWTDADNSTGTGPANQSPHAPEADTSSMAQFEATIRFQYLAWGVTGTSIAVLGLVGNVLSIVVLSHRRMKSSTSSYLTALALYDSLVLVSLVLSMALPSIYNQTGYLEYFYQLFPYIQPYAYPLALISQTCSIYTTVGFTVERYIAVCMPLRAAKMCTISRARKSILVILLCSVVYNIPRMLEYTTVTRYNPATNQTEAAYETTAVGKNPTFRYVYFIVMHITVMLVVPFTLLMVLNALLIRAIKRSACTQGRITSTQRHENNLTVMLLSVVVVFLACQVLSIVDNICMAVLAQDVLYTLPFIQLTCVSSLMVITNSATNFYLYCVFGRKFRHVFCAIFCSCSPRLAGRWGGEHQHTQVSGGSNHHRPTVASPRPGARGGGGVMSSRTRGAGGNCVVSSTVAENGSRPGTHHPSSDKDKYSYRRLPALAPSSSPREMSNRETVM